ncbi:MAG: polymerase sigma-32 factor [Pseudomonadota bacterium]|jgi:RNA polymerase sigma-32 factor|nr:polymerase sigma-32 factor [Pseudomonadota bacterium]
MTNLALNNLPAVSNGSIDAYINYVNSIPLLTEKEEFDYAEKWRQQEDVEAAKHLVLSHLRLVVSISRNYLGYGLPFADIIQEGTIGLMKAVKRFDTSHKVRLVTFAMHWIKAEINDFVIKNWRIVRTVTTKAQRKLFFNLRSQREDIGNLSDREASRIALNLNVSKSDVIEMNMRLTGSDVALIGDCDSESSPIDWLSDNSSSPENMLERKAQDHLHTVGITHALDQLDERSRRIVQARWLLDSENQLTLHDLAAEFGISAERVRQIEVKALQKMRGFLEPLTA